MNFNNVSIHIGSGFFASQVFGFFGGLFLLLIGAAIIHTLASWRFRGLQVDGEIIGVPDEAREQHAPMLWTLTVVLLLSGAWLIYVGATVSKHSLGAWVVILLAVVKPLAVPEPWGALPIDAAAPLGASATSFTPQSKSSGSKSRRAGMIFVVLGLSVLRYLPGKPITAAFDRGLSNWEPFVALAVMGIMLTGLGSVALRSQTTGESP